MAGIKSKPLPSGKYQGWYQDSDGRRRWFKGTCDRKESLAMARKFEDDHRQVKLGYRDAAKPWDRFRLRDIDEAITEYLAWGKAQGGIGGHPWSAKHQETRARHLAFWKKTLRLETLKDLHDIQSQVESTLRDMRKKSGDAPTGKTLENYCDGLRAFCEFLHERRQLERNPLAGVAQFKIEPVTTRRALSLQEIHTLQSWLHEHGRKSRRGRWAQKRQLAYSVALLTGLRKNEIQQLQPRHFDAEHQALRLDPAWTKNRKPALQPLPAALAQILAGICEKSAPADHIVYVPHCAAEAFVKDLQNAGLAEHGPGGKADFHSLRATYSTLLDQAGASDKEIQKLMRHSASSLNQERYTKTEAQRLAALVEIIGERVMGKCATRVVAQIVGSTPILTTTAAPQPSRTSKIMGREGFEPPHANAAKPAANSDLSAQLPPPARVQSIFQSDSQSKDTAYPLPILNPSAPQTIKICAAGVAGGLDEINRRWATLPLHIQAAICALVSSTPAGSAS